MLRMLGRLMWVAVGALGVKALEETSKQNSNRTPRATAGNGTAARRSRKRKS